MNAVEIEEALSYLALQPFDAAEFPFAFLAAFGNKETALKRLRSGNNNASDVPGGVLQRSNIHLAVCEPGKTGGTVSETLKALRASPATTKARAKFIKDPTMNAKQILTKSRARSTSSQRSNGEKRGFGVPAGREVGHPPDWPTRIAARNPAITGATGRKKPNR